MSSSTHTCPWSGTEGKAFRSAPPTWGRPRRSSPDDSSSGGLGKRWFGYSFLSRQDVKLGLSLSTTGVHDVIPGQVGMEDYVSQYRLDEKLSETWLGLTWSYKLRRNIGVGDDFLAADYSNRLPVAFRLAGPLRSAPHISYNEA